MDEAKGAKVTIIVDNTPSPGFQSEHGFSALLDTGKRRVLFDTGQGPAFAGNMEKLGVANDEIEAVVLSHGHYDHTGGLPAILRAMPRVPVFAHPSIVIDRYAAGKGHVRSVAVPEASRRLIMSPETKMVWCEAPLLLGDEAGITGQVPRLTSYEDTGGPFFVYPDCKVPDLIPDDMAMWVRTGKGLLVVTGCCHSGLVNTLRHAMRLSGEQRLHCVIGGFHLCSAAEERLSSTIEDLEKMSPGLIVPCHCTGETAIFRMKKVFGERVVTCSSGSEFVF